MSAMLATARTYDAPNASEPFDIDLVIARLEALELEGKPAFRRVRGAADYAGIQKISDFAPPEAFVVLAREIGDPLAGQGRQAATAAFGVVIAGRNYSYQRGKPALDSIRPLIGAVRRSLIGWIPADDAGRAAPGARPCAWQSGDTLDYSAGTVLWSEVYTTQHFIGSRQ